VSTGAIVAIAVVGLLVAVLIPLRIDVARQRRAVETARARLAGAKVRRQAAGVSVEVVQLYRESLVHVPRSATVTLADDGLYCLSEDGRWGGRVPFAPGAPGPGDDALVAPPALVKSAAVVDANLPGWLATGLAALPPDGILLQLRSGLSWFVAVPETDGWYAALMQAVRAAPGARA